MNIKNIMSKRLAAFGLSVAAALSGGYLIIPSEGSVTNPGGLHTVYLDAVGIPTACQGLTGQDMYGRDFQVGMTYTQEECDKMFVQRVQRFEKQIDSVVKVPYQSVWQKAALLSFTYNVGYGAFRSSTLLKHLNSGNHEAACKELSKWVYANKKRLKGLVARRGLEYRWCMGEVEINAQQAYQDLVYGAVTPVTPNNK